MLRVPFVLEPTNAEEFAATMRAIKAAERRDKAKSPVDLGALQRSGKRDDAILHAATTEAAVVVLTKMTEIKSKLQEYLFRRSRHGKDSQGNSIVDIPPYVEQMLSVSLYQDECEFMASYASEHKYTNVSLLLHCAHWMSLLE